MGEHNQYRVFDLDRESRVPADFDAALPRQVRLAMEPEDGEDPRGPGRPMKSRAPITEEQIQKLCDLYLRTHKYPVAADAANIDRERARDILAERGLLKPRIHRPSTRGNARLQPGQEHPSNG